jgi:hypothetical protein
MMRIKVRIVHRLNLIEEYRRDPAFLDLPRRLGNHVAAGEISSVLREV